MSDVRTVLWFAVIPALLSLAVLLFWVRDPSNPSTPTPRESNPLRSASKLPAAFWMAVTFGGVLTLARFSEAFLVIRAQELGIALALVPVVLVVMNLAYTAIAYPAGVAADGGHRRALLVWGLAALIAADLVLASTTDRAWFFAAIALWGVHMGLTQGLLSTLVADAAPPELRGTAFGVFHLVSGAALLAASVLAGWLWASFGAAWAFYAGALFSAAALTALLLRPRRGSA